MRNPWIASVALILALAGCSPASDQGAGAKRQPVLKIGSQKGSTRALLEASGVLAGAPYRVDWSEFGAASPLLEALGAGAVDVGLVGDAPFVFAYAAHAPIQAVMAYHTSTSAMSLVALIVPANSPIKTVEDLRGRKVATVRGSVGHYLLLRLLQTHGVDPKTVQTVFLDPGSSRGALSTGAVDAWSTWGSYVGYALLQDHDRQIADGHGLMDGLGFYAANRASITAKGPLIEDLVGRLGRAYAWGHTHQDAYAQRISAETGLPLDVARDTARRLLTATPTALDDSLQRQEAETLSVFQKAGVISAPPDLNGAFATQFNRAIQQANTP